LEQRSATPMLGLIAPFGEILEGAIFGRFMMKIIVG
jgi:hypothetical protein